jgi:hypothetical protein
MVRRSTGNSLVDFIDIIDEDHLKSEFVPIFDNLAHDDQVKESHQMVLLLQ